MNKFIIGLWFVFILAWIFCMGNWGYQAFHWNRALKAEDLTLAFEFGDATFKWLIRGMCMWVGMIITGLVAQNNL